LRDATLEDLASIVEIYNSTIPGRVVSADTEPVSVEQRLPWFHEHDPARRPIWVAEEDGEVVGWLSLGDFWDGRPAYDGTAEIGIYVKEDHRGGGIGGHMLEEAIGHKDPDRGGLRRQRTQPQAVRTLRLRKMGVLSTRRGTRR
jgi:phosphinothricin acetyltransferase